MHVLQTFASVRGAGEHTSVLCSVPCLFAYIARLASSRTLHFTLGPCVLHRRWQTRCVHIQMQARISLATLLTSIPNHVTPSEYVLLRQHLNRTSPPPTWAVFAHNYTTTGRPPSAHPLTTSAPSAPQPVRGEAEDMIWEVDDDCDGCVSWLEFQTMYTRCALHTCGIHV
eukprot:366262-Chlamydomonas_euryale.AAC.5